MVQIRRLNRDKERRDKEIFDLEMVARAVIDMIQPRHPNITDMRSVLECLQLVPAWLSRCMKGTSKAVARQALGLVRAWFPHVDLGSLRKRFPEGYSPEQYEAAVQDVGDIASVIVDEMHVTAPYQ